MVRESRMLPSAARAIRLSAVSVTLMPSLPVIWLRRALMSANDMRLNGRCWQRLMTVRGIFRGSVVASTKTTCGGGSSRVFKRALKAEAESMWTSSMI